MQHGLSLSTCIATDGWQPGSGSLQEDNAETFNHFTDLNRWHCEDIGSTVDQFLVVFCNFSRKVYPLGQVEFVRHVLKATPLFSIACANIANREPFLSELGQCPDNYRVVFSRLHSGYCTYDHGFGRPPQPRPKIVHFRLW